MKGSSKVIMGTTLAMLTILAIVLGLVLVLLAELYCSLLVRRRKLEEAKPAASSLSENASTAAIQQPHDHLVPSPLSSFYAQGVLDAPRSYLFPKLPSRREKQVLVEEVERLKHGKLHELLSVRSPHQLGLASSSPSPTTIKLQQHSTQNNEIEVEQRFDDDIEACYGGVKENLMYISNPIYDNEMVARTSRVDTPFETPDSSPSRMDRSVSGSSGDEKEEGKLDQTSPSSVPLTPMKGLPTKVPLRDTRSLGTSISDSNNTNIGRSSYSSSETPSTSPSWLLTLRLTRSLPIAVALLE